MATKKRKAGKTIDEPPTKRKPKARAARRQDDPVWSTTNKNSHLVNEDLHAKFSDPKSYEGWTKEDWEEIHEDLPENVRFNEDGYSVPISYFKYDPDWRRLIREFQEDLGAGRYEPEWQAEAAQAMEERARGDFDKYKEDRFEEFWGQKQKVHWSALAGEATKIKLDEVLRSGVVKEGDYFSYSRVFGRRGWMIEKEFKIVKIENGVLTAAIPPGQLKYARRIPQTPTASQPSGEVDTRSTENNISASETTADAAEATETAKSEDTTAKTNTTNTEDQITQPPPENTEVTPKPTSNTKDEPTTTTPLSHNQQPYTEDTIHITASTLNSLESQIIDIDGRTSAKDVPAHNSWKAMRGKRNNQDLGSLFDMREEYFVRKDSARVKGPRGGK